MCIDQDNCSLGGLATLTSNILMGFKPAHSKSSSLALNHCVAEFNAGLIRTYSVHVYNYLYMYNGRCCMRIHCWATGVYYVYIYMYIVYVLVPPTMYVLLYRCECAGSINCACHVWILGTFHMVHYGFNHRRRHCIV